MPIGKNYYFLSFDLSIDNLELYYSNKNINQAWDDIKRFMTKNGFEHSQYSAYISKNKMSMYDIRDFMKSMYIRLPWFPLCANKVMLSELNSEEKLIASIAKIKTIKAMIDNIKVNAPGKDRGHSFTKTSVKLLGERPQQSKKTPQGQVVSDTVTVSISELKECFEADVELQVTVKKSDLEQAKKQAKTNKQSNTKSGDSEIFEEPPTQIKPKR